MRESYEKWKDSDLIVASVGAAAPFRELYNRWADPITSYFYRRTWDADVSIELTAETFAIAWQKRSTYQRRTQPGVAWLFGIARRELAGYRRRASVHKRATMKLGIHLAPFQPDEIAELEARIDAGRYKTPLVEALAELSTKERDALALRVIQDYSYREIASHVGCSEGAARVRVHRALGKLADLLEATT